MSTDLERLLNALWERDTCEPKDRDQWAATVERLIADALSKRPPLTREDLMDALIPRYDEFRRARRKPTSLPPKA